MERITINRLFQCEKQTLGRLFYGDYTCVTMELPWRDNQKRISRIKSGLYIVRRHISPTFGECFLITETEGRTHILMHEGNFYWNSTGCILLGRFYEDLNNDDVLDITHSKATMKEVLKLFPDEFELLISDRYLEMYEKSETVIPKLKNLLV